MKSLVLVLVLILIVGLCTTSSIQNIKDQHQNQKEIEELKKIIQQEALALGIMDAGVDLGKPGAYCATCNQFIGQNVDRLVLAIAQGIFSSCKELCYYLNGTLEQQVCSLACIYVGLEGFITLLNETNPDPLYICSVADFCPVSNDAKANVTSLTVLPNSGPVGSIFRIFCDYKVNSTIGSGQAYIGKKKKRIFYY